MGFIDGGKRFRDCSRDYQYGDYYVLVEGYLPSCPAQHNIFLVICCVMQFPSLFNQSPWTSVCTAPKSLSRSMKATECAASAPG